MRLLTNKTKNPTRPESTDPANTPNLTERIYELFPSPNANAPINKLIVNPIPHIIETPYKSIHFTEAGNLLIPNFIAIQEAPKIPNCFPKKRPKIMPDTIEKCSNSGERLKNVSPALANANNGRIPKATNGCIFFINECNGDALL